MVLSKKNILMVFLIFDHTVIIIECGICKTSPICQICFWHEFNTIGQPNWKIITQICLCQYVQFDIGANSLTAFLTDLPVRSSNMRTPRDQQSAPKSWPLFIMTSGATYSGVPQKVQVFFPRPIFLAKPKSAWKKRNVFQGKNNNNKAHNYRNYVKMQDCTHALPA